MKKIGILYHPLVEATQAKAREVRDALVASGLEVWSCSAWELQTARAQLDGTQVIVTIGGDGTILRAVQVAVAGSLPIVGVNMGKLGFMTELDARDAVAKLPVLLGGEGWVDERAMLEVESVSMKHGSQAFYALNEVVVARGAVARVVTVDADVDGEHVCSYRADGVMVATATGSTGYSLAAGGPILYPQSADLLLVPIVPHLSLGYPLVLPATATVTLRLTAFREATLSVDGHINLPLSTGDLVRVKAGHHRTRFLRLQPRAYFYRNLEKRLKRK